jgi:hypothetical protein
MTHQEQPATPQAPELSTPVLDRAEQVYQAMKKNRKKFINNYKGEAERVMRGAAINIAKKQVKTMNNERLKEIIKGKLSKGQEKIDANNDGKISGEDFKLLRSRKSVKEDNMCEGCGEEMDYEGEMAKSELYNLIQNAEKLFSMLDENTQLEAWVQSKLTKANDYLESVYQYLQSQNLPSQPQQMEEEVYYLDK